MALDGDKTGQSVADFIKASAPAAGAPMTDAALATMWKGIVNIIYGDMGDDIEVSTTVTTPDTINGTGTGTIA